MLSLPPRRPAFPAAAGARRRTRSPPAPLLPWQGSPEWPRSPRRISGAGGAAGRGAPQAAPARLRSTTGGTAGREAARRRPAPDTSGLRSCRAAAAAIHQSARCAPDRALPASGEPPRPAPRPRRPDRRQRRAGRPRASRRSAAGGGGPRAAYPHPASEPHARSHRSDSAASPCGEASRSRPCAGAPFRAAGSA